MPVEKKQPELKRQPSKILNASATSKSGVPIPKRAPTPSASAAPTVKLVQAQSITSTKTVMTASTSKMSLQGKQPSQAIQAAMQARLQAQLAANGEMTGGIDENAELPDIRSEYV